ncbi:MAG: SGNH/GDSL hydrolase family protein, partial [Ignavibacteriaceae bacterium]
FYNPLNILIILIFIIASTYIYIGFYYTDQTIFTISKIAKFTLGFIRIAFPIIIIGMLIIYYALYNKKIHIGSVVLLFFSITFILFVAYPFADYFYHKAINESLNDYHTYLQLTPKHYPDINKYNYNIFCLGGSTTEFKDNAGRDWPTMLEKSLREKYNIKNIRVYNFGRQWYTTQHLLIEYIQNLRKYKPNIIIVMENINDLLHNADFSVFSNGKFREDYGNFLGPITRLVKYGSLIEYLGDVVKSSWYKSKPKEINTDIFPGLVSYERNLRTLINLAKSDSTNVILMTEPNIYKDSMTKKELSILAMLNREAVGNGKRWSYQTAYQGLKKYNKKMSDIARKENVQLIDLESIVPKSTDYFYDDVHYKSKTYDLISEKIAENLKTYFTQ